MTHGAFRFTSFLLLMVTPASGVADFGGPLEMKRPDFAHSPAQPLSYCKHRVRRGRYKRREVSGKE